MRDALQLIGPGVYQAAINSRIGKDVNMETHTGMVTNKHPKLQSMGSPFRSAEYLLNSGALLI